MEKILKALGVLGPWLVLVGCGGSGPGRPLGEAPREGLGLVFRAADPTTLQLASLPTHRSSKFC